MVVFGSTSLTSKPASSKCIHAHADFKRKISTSSHFFCRWLRSWNMYHFSHSRTAVLFSEGGDIPFKSLAFNSILRFLIEFYYRNRSSNISWVYICKPNQTKPSHTALCTTLFSSVNILINFQFGVAIECLPHRKWIDTFRVDTHRGLGWFCDLNLSVLFRKVIEGIFLWRAHTENTKLYKLDLKDIRLSKNAYLIGSAIKVISSFD